MNDKINEQIIENNNLKKMLEINFTTNNDNQDIKSFEKDCANIKGQASWMFKGDSLQYRNCRIIHYSNTDLILLKKLCITYGIKDNIDIYKSFAECFG